MLVLHHIDKEVLHELAVFLSLVQVFQLHRAVNLGAPGRIRRSFRRKIIPMLYDQAVFIKAEDVKGTCSPAPAKL